MELLPWNPSELRTRFSKALSDMYRSEVPLYGDLVQIVREVDLVVLEEHDKCLEDLPLRNQLERHGAIRLGTEYEMHMIKRLFAILGMHPVGYYDLNIVGFPLHGTAFRPISGEGLEENPFRVFTTVLRRELISPGIQKTVDKALSQRNLFTPRLVEIIDLAEREGALSSQEKHDFITEALKIFQWYSRSTVSLEEYSKLKEEHPIIADIVCFPSAHINHLTPRTLDIDRAQLKMIENGLPAKEYIEGPPPRNCPILLRQTSFKALEETVDFADQNGKSTRGTHTARFGEIEQRGAALTRKGRELHDQLHTFAVRNSANVSGSSLSTVLSNVFRKFPDSWEELQAQKLVFFQYNVTNPTEKRTEGECFVPPRIEISRLLSLGLIQYEPITYEDFLPFSAAGIFKSNLPDQPTKTLDQREFPSNPARLEAVLNSKILDEFELYQHLQDDSIEKCKDILGLCEIIQD